MIKVNQLNLCKGGDFPNGPVVKTSLSSVGNVGSIPDLVAKSPGAWQPKRKNKHQNVEIIKTLKNGTC